MHPLIQLKTTSPLFITLALLCFGFLPGAQAVVPAPDGGYGPPDYGTGNTAEGEEALLNLSSGGYNTAAGFRTLFTNTTGNFNTALGAGALFTNTGEENTATGAGALLSNTMGSFNTANGEAALFYNTTGDKNTAMGHFALGENTTGSLNTATGSEALSRNTTGRHNTAIGFGALAENTTGREHTTIGFQAGLGVSTAANVICIGANVAGANVSNSCYIGNIFNRSSPSGLEVFVNSDGKLGTTMSSSRFKEDIKPMDQASEAILALQPVRFRYKKDFDPTGTAQFGLVAEDVAKVNPDLVVRDKEGKPYSVRYDQVNAMLLNEFL